MKLSISPSLMSADLLKIGSELSALDQYAYSYHIDIIDWHYVKNMCLTPQVMAAIRSATTKPIDAHLYVDNIEEDLVKLCLDSGANTVIMPSDVISRSINRLSSYIHGHGAKVGVFLNPSQSLDTIESYAIQLDCVLIMSVDPGFGGQAFVPGTYGKISQARNLREHIDAHYKIYVDGNCNHDRFLPLARAGADVLALGRGLFGRSKDTAEAARLTYESVLEVERTLS